MDIYWLLEMFRMSHRDRFRDYRDPPYSDVDILRAIEKFMQEISPGSSVRIQTDEKIYAGRLKKITLKGNRLYFKFANSNGLKIPKSVSLKQLVGIVNWGDGSHYEGEESDEGRKEE